MKIRTRASVIALIVSVRFACAAFGQESVESTLAKLNGLASSERNARLASGAQSEGQLEWYATLNFEDAKILIEAFRRAHPAVEVKYTRGIGGSLVNRVVTEYRSGLKKFDVLGGTSTSHTALMQAGLIARNLAPVRKELRDGFLDADGYRVAPFTYAIVIGHNARTVSKDERPRTHENLLEAK